MTDKPLSLAALTAIEREIGSKVGDHFYMNEYDYRINDLCRTVRAYREKLLKVKELSDIDPSNDPGVWGVIDDIAAEVADVE